MKSTNLTILVLAMCVSLVSVVSADTFGTGGNQFTIDFVTISGDTNPTSGYGIVNNDYRMGTYEITNDQWNKFKASYGTVTGDPSTAYDAAPHFTGDNIPTNNASWYEAAQFVNYLNTSTGHQAAYRFTGTQGTANFALATWYASDADNGTNLFRHKDAKYYLPTEDEWVKAAYWNGTDIQTYATKAGDTLHQGDGLSGTGWRYDTTSPWAVGGGSEELNGTFDMMGNVWEWMESPNSETSYGTDSPRTMRGGSWDPNDFGLPSSFRIGVYPNYDYIGNAGFRVASVPEPATLSILGLSGLALVRRRRAA